MLTHANSLYLSLALSLALSLSLSLSLSANSESNFAGNPPRKTLYNLSRRHLSLLIHLPHYFYGVSSTRVPPEKRVATVNRIVKMKKTKILKTTGGRPATVRAPTAHESRRPQPLFFLGGGGKIALVSVPIALVSAACRIRKAELRHANKSMQMSTREILCSCVTSWVMYDMQPPV